MKKQYITIEEYCKVRKVEESFIIRLEQSGLIEIILIEEERCIHESQLHNLEKFSEWHYELEIGTPGIEAIQHLLIKVEKLQEEVRYLKERLNND